MSFWQNRCRVCNGEAADISGDPPSEHVEPCGHDGGYYGMLIPGTDPDPEPPQ